MTPDLEAALTRLKEAVADAEAGGRFDDRRDDGSVAVVATADLKLILSVVDQCK